MKKLLIILFVALYGSAASFAQELKFGHVNMQEVIFLMDEMDSAQVVLEKYSRELQETFVSMQNEFQTKVNNYEQMSANWTPAVVQAKTQELESMQQRLQQFQASAQQDLQAKQQELLTPIQAKAFEAVETMGKANGFVYIFDISAGSVCFVNDAISVDVTEMLKKALNIPLDKKLKAQQPAQ
ncbi:MAG: OmpH family outer membrane protein [Bacteroidales bacterium]|jgi:outer membrane protein|nr:OmpH family outer membrane protein [Bacteroidales bacterium]